MHDRATDSGYIWRRLSADLPGILLALAIAFGSLFLVENRLSKEKEQLLESGGAVTVQAQTQWIEADKLDEAAIGLEEAILSQEELLRAVEGMEGAGVVSPHEPKPGQLSMEQAVSCGEEWIEGFLLPHLGSEDASLQEYQVNCYLWTKEEEGEDAGGNESHSYWNITLKSQDTDAQLSMSAVTGQVLYAMVGYAHPIEHEEDIFMRLAEDYMESFGIGADYVALGEEVNEWSVYQACEDGVLSATVEVSDVVVSAIKAVEEWAQGTIYETQDYFYIRLYLESED